MSAFLIKKVICEVSILNIHIPWYKNPKIVLNLPVISGRSTRKIPKSSRVPRSPFVIFLVHFFQKNYAGCGALLYWRLNEIPPSLIFLKEIEIFDLQKFLKWTGADRRGPAQTGANRRRPARTGADRRRPAQTGYFQCLPFLSPYQDSRESFHQSKSVGNSRRNRLCMGRLRRYHSIWPLVSLQSGKATQPRAYQPYLRKDFLQFLPSIRLVLQIEQVESSWCSKHALSENWRSIYGVYDHHNVHFSTPSELVVWFS